MGMPNINIAFKSQASATVTRSLRGIVAVVLLDSGELGGHTLLSVTDIPSGLTDANKGILTRAFLGYVNPPQKVIAYVMDGTASTIDTALSYFALQDFDYLVGTGAEGEPEKIAAWVKSERTNKHLVKAVVPNYAADSEAIVNFSADGIKVGAVSYTAAQYCSRIAGLIAGTPLSQSCTYAPLPEVTEITKLSNAEMDAAVDAGKFILMHDGEKVKTVRGVNSLTTVTADKGAKFKKIKIVDAEDMIERDIRKTAQDSYIGKFSNSYDHKCLLISAIKGYFESLEADGLLKSGASGVSVDTAAQESYLKAQGTDTSSMNEQEIKEADTGSEVFLKAGITILDAIEDITLAIAV